MEIGAHVSASGGIDTAVDRIDEMRGDCVQVFTQSPRMWRTTNHKPEAIERSNRETIEELCEAFRDRESPRPPRVDCDRAAISVLLSFFNSYDQKWRETCELVVRQKGLTPAYANDAMDHLVTYQYWAILMLLWSASPFGGGRPDTPALVVDEINSRMWDALRLGHLAIKERVGNLIHWGFFAEQTIKKHKAAALTPL